MNHVMIVEDNQEYIEQISTIVDKRVKRCIISYAVNSSEKALEIISNQDVTLSIVIVNIKIAFGSGIDLVSEIKIRDSRTRIILLSEYNYFEFMKRAINQKVDDYILMPCNDYDIENGLQLCLKEIEKASLYQERIENALTDYKEAKVYIENSFIYSMIFSKPTNREIGRFQKILHISEEGITISLNILEEDLRRCNRDTLYQKLFSLIHQFDSKLYRFIVGPLIKNRIIIYLAFLADNIDERETEVLISMVRETIEQELICEVKIGTSSVKKVINMYTAYQEAINNLNYHRIRKEFQVESTYKELESKFLLSLRVRDGRALEYLSPMLIQINKGDREYIQSTILELLVLIHHTIGGFDSSYNTGYDFISYLVMIKEKPVSEISEWFFHTVEYIQITQINKNRIYSEIVWSSIKIIQEEYAKNISLEGVAKLVGVSSQYLSKIFKEETKMTFIEWVTRLRIDKAKEIIQDQEQAIKEVGVLVGYKDPNYFSRIFRSVLGMTPSQYREKVKKEAKVPLEL